MNEYPIMKSNDDQHLFSFKWYHREEFQVLVILVGLIVFFARSLWVLGTLAALVVCVIFLLYLIRVLEIYLMKHGRYPRLVQRYHNLKTALHGRSVERSRIAMALLAAWVVGVLFLHRIHLALLDPDYKTPTDIYWILFLGWYCLICTVTAMYLMWLWNTWSQNESKHVPFLDGLVASLFFYRGLSRKNRIVTFIATFWLGGLPSYVAIRLTPETPYGYWIACGLLVPLIGLFFGGAYYTMVHLQNSSVNKS
jgi:hypothetical protein